MDKKRRLKRLICLVLCIVLIPVNLTVGSNAEGGMFKPAESYKAGIYPSMLVSGDFNGDGIADLVTYDFVTFELMILTGKGSGLFNSQVKTIYHSPNEITELCTGDIDYDGKLDIIIGDTTDNNDGYWSDVSVLYGNSDGSFSKPYSIHRISNTQTTGVKICDFNNDNIHDLALSFGIDAIHILLGKSDGTFNSPSEYPVGKGPVDGVAGDFDGDNKLDFITANADSGNLSFLKGTGNGEFNDAVNMDGFYGTRGMATGDFNKDGIDDLVEYNKTEINIILGKKESFGSNKITYDKNKDLFGDLTVGDFNLDGNPDIAIFDGGYNLRIFRGKGDGTFVNSTEDIYSFIKANYDLISEDFDKDGKMDLASANRLSSCVSIIMNSFIKTSPTPRKSPTPTAKPTVTLVIRPTETTTPTVTPTIRPMETTTPTVTPTIRPTETTMPTVTPTMRPIATTEPTATQTIKSTATTEPTVTPTIKPTATATPTITQTITQTIKPTATTEPTVTLTVKPTVTAETTATPTIKSTSTEKPIATPTYSSYVTSTTKPTDVLVVTINPPQISPVDNIPILPSFTSTATSKATPAATAISTAAAILTATPTTKATATATQKSILTAAPTIAITPTPTVLIENADVKKPGGAGFKDAVNHWAVKYIDFLFLKGIITGYSDRTIKPDNDITRAEMAVILVKTFGFDTKGEKSVKYTDSSKIPSWAVPYVSVLKENGIIKGYEDGSFRPNNKIIRAEMITMVMRAFKKEPSNRKLDKFKDTDRIPAWARGYVAAGVDYGILSGYSDGTFRPLMDIKRGEAFAVIAKCLELLKK